MAKSRHPNLGGATPRDLKPTSVNNLPLAWDWRFRKINSNSLREFANYIHSLIECGHDQAKADAVALLQELVEKARDEHE